MACGAATSQRALAASVASRYALPLGADGAEWERRVRVHTARVFKDQTGGENLLWW